MIKINYTRYFDNEKELKVYLLEGTYKVMEDMRTFIMDRNMFNYEKIIEVYPKLAGKTLLPKRLDSGEIVLIIKK